MAGPADVVERSMSINASFYLALSIVEQNALLRIGWTGSGEEVPKNGEVGLCPSMPEGARIRALGKLGSWTSSFGNGGQFDLEGMSAHFWRIQSEKYNICNRLCRTMCWFHDASGQLSSEMVLGTILVCS